MGLLLLSIRDISAVSTWTQLVYVDCSASPQFSLVQLFVPWLYLQSTESEALRELCQRLILTWSEPHALGANLAESKSRGLSLATTITAPDPRTRRSSNPRLQPSVSLSSHRHSLSIPSSRSPQCPTSSNNPPIGRSSLPPTVSHDCRRKVPPCPPASAPSAWINH